jgi:hypothetical protein
MTEWYKNNESAIFPDYLDGELFTDIKNFVNGSGKLSRVLSYFFDRLMFTYTRKDSKFSPMQVLENEDLLELLWKRVDSKPNMFPNGRGDVRSFQTAIAVGWSKCRALANFPPKEASAIYKKYCPPRGLIYDPSAGWGSRMAAALLSGYGYVATDPNSDLIPVLQKFYGFLLNTDYVSQEQIFQVRCHGSEVDIPWLHGKVDFVFTSPPYFDLEIYSNDKSASTRNYGNYRAWVKEYVAPTIINIKNYLKPGAVAVINIKDLPKYKLYGCWRKVFHIVKGFKELEPYVVNIARRHYGKGKGESLEEKLKNYFLYADHEYAMVFQKE